VAIAIKGLTIGCTATVFPPLRGSKSAREPGVEAVGKSQRLFSALTRSIINLKIAPILKIQSTYRGKQT
jgi:hypothetical protein